MTFLFASLLMLWMAGQRVVPSQAPVSPPSPITCIEAVVAARPENAQIRGPFCGSIEGLVLRAGSMTGIANAQVKLNPPIDGAPDESLTVVTDSNGRFIFRSINPAPRPGGYIISAVADGYAPTIFGQTRPYSPGEKVSVGRRENVRGIIIELNPYPSASGSVRTSHSQPLAAALVRLYRIQYSLVGRRLKIAKTAFTNDLGAYRLLAMEPGDYYVSASYSERARTSYVSGTQLTPNLSNPDAGFVTAFYGDSISAFDAIAFTMVPTSGRSNLDITTKEAIRFRIHVKVFSSAGSPSSHFDIALMPYGADLGDAPDYAVKRNGEAEFDIPDVGPGRYSLVAFDKSRMLSEAIPVNADQDQEVKIPIYDPLDVSGIIVDDSGKPVSGRMQVRLVRTDPELGQTIRADVDSGNFTVPNVGPGAYDVYVDGLPPGTYIKAVQFPINDNLFGRIRIEPDKPRKVLDPVTQRWKSEPVIQVVLTALGATVEGTVWTGVKWLSGPEVVANARVVLEPDRQSNSLYALREDRYLLDTSDGSGHFQFKGVPPGSYTAFAFYEIQQGLYYDSQFNDLIRDLGTPVIVRDTQTLEMTACEDSPPPDTKCLVPVPREKSSGVAP